MPSSAFIADATPRPSRPCVVNRSFLWIFTTSRLKLDRQPCIDGVFGCKGAELSSIAEAEGDALREVGVELELGDKGIAVERGAGDREVAAAGKDQRCLRRDIAIGVAPAD